MFYDKNSIYLKPIVFRTYDIFAKRRKYVIIIDISFEVVLNFMKSLTFSKSFQLCFRS